MRAFRQQYEMIVFCLISSRAATRKRTKVVFPGITKIRNATQPAQKHTDTHAHTHTHTLTTNMFTIEVSPVFQNIFSWGVDDIMSVWWCVVVCGGVWRCVVVCGGVGRCVVGCGGGVEVCSGVWRCVVVCGGVWRRVEVV